MKRWGSIDMIRVVVVDDYPVVREGLKRIICESAGMVVAGEAGNGHEALDVIRSKPCDVLLLGLDLSARGGLDMLRELRAQRSKLPVLVLSTYANDRYAA